MLVTFYGVRGSIASPGPRTVKYGGNTSCVHIRLNSGHNLIFDAGTGNPFFTTDSAACLRGIEIDADIVLKATKVDGVYSADPMIDKTATRYDRLTYDEVLDRQLGVMDLTAICLARDHGMPLRVFAMEQSGALRNAVVGEDEGTLIERE